MSVSSTRAIDQNSGARAFEERIIVSPFNSKVIDS
jgi:hypothetical protein